MKDEKELWLDENEVMSLLEGKATWDQIHGKPEKKERANSYQNVNSRSAYDNRSGFYGRNDRAGRVDSGWDMQGNRQGNSQGSSDFQNTLTPRSIPASRYTTGSALQKPQYMTKYQAQKTPQVLPGPANETDWLRPQNPHIKMIEAEDENVFFTPTSHNGAQRADEEYSRLRPSMTAIPKRDSSSRSARSMDFGKTPLPEHRGSSRQRDNGQGEPGRFFVEDHQEELSWRATSGRQFEKSLPYDRKMVDEGFFQTDDSGFENEANRSEGFFQPSYHNEPSKKRESFFSDSPGSMVETLNENYFEPARDSNVNKGMRPQETDMGFVSANPNITDIRRAPSVRIAAHVPSRKRQLVLTGGADTSPEWGSEKEKVPYSLSPQGRGNVFESNSQEGWAVQPRDEWAGPRDEWTKPRLDNKVVNINRGAGKTLTGSRLSFDEFDKMSESDAPSSPNVPIVTNDKFIMGPRTSSGKTGSQYKESDLMGALDRLGGNVPSNGSYPVENRYNRSQLEDNPYTEGYHQYHSQYNEDQFLPVSLYSEQTPNIPVPRQYSSVPNKYAMTSETPYPHDLSMTNPNLNINPKDYRLKKDEDWSRTQKKNFSGNPASDQDNYRNDLSSLRSKSQTGQYRMPFSERGQEDKIDQLHRSMRAEEYEHHGDYNHYSEFDRVNDYDHPVEHRPVKGYDHYKEPGNYSTDSLQGHLERSIQDDSVPWGEISAPQTDSVALADSEAYYEEKSPYKDDDPLSAYEMLAAFDGPELENTFERFEDTGRFRYDFGELDNTLGDSQSFPKFTPEPSDEFHDFGIQGLSGDSVYGEESRGRREYYDDDDDDDDDKLFSSERRSMRISQRMPQYETHYGVADDDERKGFRLPVGWMVGVLSLAAVVLLSILLFILLG